MRFPFKKFISYYRPYKGLFFLDMACAVVVAIIALLLPQGIRHITDVVLRDASGAAVRPLLITGGAMLGLTCISAACNYVCDYRGHAMGAMMERDMRGELFRQYGRLSFGFFDSNKPGQLLSRITNDLLSLAEFYHHGPEDYLIYGIKFIGALALLWQMDARLTLIICAFLPPMLVFTLLYNRRLQRAFDVNLERIGDVNAQVEETLSGIRTVKAYANEQVAYGQFDAQNQRFYQSRVGIYRTEARFFVTIGTLAQCMTVAAVTFGGLAILGTRLALSELIAVLLYVGYLTDPIPRLAHITRQFQEGVAGFKRFMEIMELSPEIEDAPDAAEITGARGHIAFEGVGFSYGEGQATVLEDIDFSVPAGGYVAVVGSSGVGKTTLCSLIPRFYDVTAGRITLDGRDIREITQASLRRQIGVVQQETYLFSGTVLENIRFAKPGAPLAEVERAARLAGAEEFIRALPQGYDTDIGPKGVRLSGGQRQRLSIARVFLKDPPILILDEATSSLDMDSERQVQASLEALARERTTFVIAHRLSTIRNARTIIVLEGTGIAEAGTHVELMARNGVYAKLYREA